MPRLIFRGRIVRVVSTYINKALIGANGACHTRYYSLNSTKIGTALVVH